MPELPEVETVRRALAPVMENRVVESAYVGRPDLRWPLPENLAERLRGRRLAPLQRRGKFILLPLDQDETMLLHLGMSGSVRIHENEPITGKHDHMILTMSGADDNHARSFIVLNDPRRFGWVDLFRGDTHPMLANMGPEPLGNQFSAAYLADALSARNGPIKNALLNQQIVAGIGNIYACEALFYAGISPRRKANTIKGARADRLVTEIRTVLQRAIAEGGTSLRDHIQPGGEIGYFVQSLAVYGRTGEGCINCDTPIRTIVQSGRSSFYCPKCQR